MFPLLDFKNGCAIVISTTMTGLVCKRFTIDQQHCSNSHQTSSKSYT